MRAGRLMSQQVGLRPKRAVAPLSAFQPWACRQEWMGSHMVCQGFVRRKVVALAAWDRAGTRLLAGEAVDVVRLVPMDLAEVGSAIESGSDGIRERMHCRVGRAMVWLVGRAIRR